MTPVDDETLLAKLAAWAERMPDEPFLRGMRTYTPRELVQEVRDRTQLGERFLATWREMEAAWTT